MTQELTLGQKLKNNKVEEISNIEKLAENYFTIIEKSITKKIEEKNIEIIILLQPINELDSFFQETTNFILDKTYWTKEQSERKKNITKKVIQEKLEEFYIKMKQEELSVKFLEKTTSGCRGTYTCLLVEHI